MPKNMKEQMDNSLLDKGLKLIICAFNEQKNTVRQNEWHIDVLKKIIKQNMTYYSIIVFTDRADISWIDKKQNKTYITNINYLNNKIYSIYENSSVKPYNNYKSVAGYLRRFAI